MPTETSTSTSSQRVSHRWRSRPLRSANGDDTTPLALVTPILLDMEAEFTPPVFPKTAADRAVIRKNICGHFAFKDAPEEETEQLIDAFERHEADEGREVIRQGAVGDYYLYMIGDGSVTYIVNGEQVGFADSGDLFGELAILYNCPRQASVFARSPCVLWRIHQTTFRRILASNSLKEDTFLQNTIVGVLRKVPLFDGLDDTVLSRIVAVMSTQTFVQGQVIIEKGNVCQVDDSSFYVIKTGQVRVQGIVMGGSKFFDQILGPGEYFGESALKDDYYKDCKRNATIVNESKKTVLLSLSKADFNELVGSLGDLLKNAGERRMLVALPIFKRLHLGHDELDALTSRIVDSDFDLGHCFFMENSVVKSPALYFIRSGSVTVTTIVGRTTILREGAYFGDNMLYGKSEGSDHQSKETIIAHADCCIGVLKLDTILQALNRESLLTGESQLRLSVKWGERRAGNNESSGFEEKLKFKKHAMLGEGGFGKVWLVTVDEQEPNDFNDKNKRKMFALKVQSKRMILDRNVVEFMVREKYILESLDSPFIMKLVHSFSDENNIYLLNNFIPGGELHTLLYERDRQLIGALGNQYGLHERDAKFYAAGVLSGLSHMHTRNILYRDLKPENVLLDHRGYPVLVDLGFAKVVPMKTFTMCGTPSYLAPEVITQRGHDKGADHWSLGVLIFEMITGTKPFSHKNTLKLFNIICKGKFSSTTNGLSTEAKDLVYKLLMVQAKKRLGSLSGGNKDIYDHTWFEDIDFGRLLSREIKSPWKPEVRDTFDVKNFGVFNGEADEEENNKPLCPEEHEMFEAIIWG